MQVVVLQREKTLAHVGENYKFGYSLTLPLILERQRIRGLVPLMLLYYKQPFLHCKNDIHNNTVISHISFLEVTVLTILDL